MISSTRSDKDGIIDSEYDNSPSQEERSQHRALIFSCGIEVTDQLTMFLELSGWRVDIIASSSSDLLKSAEIVFTEDADAFSLDRPYQFHVVVLRDGDASSSDEENNCSIIARPLVLSQIEDIIDRFSRPN